MSLAREVVITGLGVVSPIGIGEEAFWASLSSAQSGVRRLTAFDASTSPIDFGAEVVGFDPKQYVKPRKSLKVMSRDIQLGVTAADLACSDARIAAESIDPDRFGVVFGSDMIQCQPEDVAGAFRRCLVDGTFDFREWGRRAMEEVYPLWMLKYLPNMPACHIAIAHDARGPNNSVLLAESSSLLALSEAVRVIERGQADIMISGGTGSRIHPTIWARNRLLCVSQRVEDPAGASRPFDALRDGFVNGEGSAAVIVESLEHARRRGANVRARVLAYSSCFEPQAGDRPATGSAIRRGIGQALTMAGLKASDLGHVNAHGLSTPHDDCIEAKAIRDVLGAVPVTAPKSFFGNLGSGTGAVELAASLLALEKGLVPVTLNYEHPDRECPVSVVRGEPLAGRPGTALVLNQSPAGQAVALVIASPQ
ncbi:MAG: beta-ketoacyl-[acyl-carrier-protein] synthase family protein [Pirellulales bacterium]